MKLNRSSGPKAPGISRQTYGIIPKIREVDELITRSLQSRIVEAHPEMCFYEMNHCLTIVEPKKKAAGRKRRVQLLEKVWRVRLSDMIESRPRGVARDDILDAMVVCWTAERVLDRRAISIPEKPPRDARELRMEIVR